MRQLCSLIPPQPLSCFLVQMHRLQISPLKIYRPQSPGWRPGSPGYDSDSQNEKPHCALGCKTFKLSLLPLKLSPQFPCVQESFIRTDRLIGAPPRHASIAKGRWTINP
ncbi:unnamed protein product [Caretta caretta]